MKYLCLSTLVLLASSWAVADNQIMGERETSNSGFFEERADGWHWYEDPPPETVPEEEELPPPAQAMTSPAKTAGPPPLSTAWIRESLPVLRDRAIDDPSSINVSAYMYAQRIMMDKAQVFSDRVKETVEADPLLDENLRLPFASAAKVAVLQSAAKKKQELLDGLREKVGIWLFYDETCVHCKAQLGPINQLVRKNSMTVEVISLYGDQIDGLDERVKVRIDDGHFKRLGVNFKPAVMMVAPPDGFYLVSQGFTAYTTLVDRVLAAANRYGFVKQEDFYDLSPMSKGILRADSVKAPEVNWDDSEDWVPFVQKQIRKTYGLDPGEEEIE